MKTHYDSDLHADNVKRRVNGIVPLTSQAHGARSRIATSVQSTSYKCGLCDKRFATPQTLSSHLQSQKHKEKKAKAKVQKEADEATTDEKDEKEDPKEEAAATLLSEAESWEATATRVKNDEALTGNDCLFCNLKSPSAEDALCHMVKAHRFTLPLSDRITDVAGLMEYLALKVNGALCLVCGDSKLFECRAGCQDHMASAGHCMIKLSENEYSDFYNESIPKFTEAAAGDIAEDNYIPTPGGAIVSKHEKKNNQTPVQYRDESIPQEKLLLTQQSRAHMTVQQMSRYQGLLAAREKLGKKEERMERNHVRYQQKQHMRLGVHLNNLHGKVWVLCWHVGDMKVFVCVVYGSK